MTYYYILTENEPTTPTERKGAVLVTQNVNGYSVLNTYFGVSVESQGNFEHSFEGTVTMYAKSLVNNVTLVQTIGYSFFIHNNL